MGVDHAKVASLFDAAADLTGADREALLDKRCGDDADLRAAVEGLLAHDGVASIDVVPEQVRTAAAQALEHATLPTRIGRFPILSRVGEGGMGVVFAAFDERLDRRVALKILRSGEDARLLREARSMARIDHPNVATVYESDELADGRVWIAMEFLHGGNLQEWLEEGPHGWLAIARRFIAAGEGLAAAHEAGVLHRDFKPENVMLGADGRPRVVDFGLAALDPRVEPAADSDRPSDVAGSLTIDGTVMGTLRYMSPEQVAGERVEEASDQFNFCAALAHALYGEVPYGDGSLSERRRAFAEAEAKGPLVLSAANVPESFGAILTRGLALDPAERWPSTRALVAELARYVDEEYERDINVHHRTRRLGSLFVAAVGVGTLPFMDPAEVADAATLLRYSGLSFVTMLVATIALRKVFRQQASRRIMALAWLVILSIICNRAVATHYDLPVAAVAGIDCFIFALINGAAAITFRRWFAWVALAGVCGLVLGLVMPTYAVQFMLGVMAASISIHVMRFPSQAGAAKPDALSAPSLVAPPP